MSIDFSSIGATPAHTGKVDFSALGAVPAVDQGDSSDDTTALGAAGRGAVGMLPLGNQAYSAIAGLAEKKPYLQERQELEKEIQSDIANHQPARFAGQAAGLIAPAVLTGGASAPESLLEAAGQGAAVGGGFGAGNAIDTLAGGGSGSDAALDVAKGAGIGAAGGAIGEGIGNAISKGVDSLGSTSVGQRLQSENVSKALGLRPISLSTIARKEGSTPQAAAQHIWEDISSLPGLPENFTAPTSSINDKVATLESLKDAAGNTIGVTRNLGGHATAGNFPEGDQAVKDLVTAAEGFKGIPDGRSENMKSVAAQIQAAKASNNLDFNTLSQVRSAVGSQVQSEVPGASQIYRILSDNLDKTLDRVGDTAGIDKAAFQGAKKTYAVTSKVLPLMQRGAGREATGTGGGLQNLAGGLGLVTGHPAAALPAVAHGIQKLVAPEALPNLMLGGGAGKLGSAIAGQLPTAAAQTAAAQVTPTKAITDIHLQHPAMAPWRQTFATNAQRATNPAELEKSNAVTDFTLSQRDPAYAAAKQKATDSPEAQDTSVNPPTKMADGGVVDEPAYRRPVPGFGSTLPGLAQQMRNPSHEAPPEPVPPERTAPSQFHQSFNPQFEDQLKAFLLKSKENEDAE